MRTLNDVADATMDDGWKVFDEFNGVGEVDTRGVLIRIKDPLALAKAQGGSSGALAAGVAPGFVTGKVLDTVKDKITTALKEQGVGADVSVVESAAYRPASSSSPLVSIGLVIGGALVGGVLGTLAARRKRR